MENKSTGITENLIIKVTGEKDFKKIQRLDFYSKSNKLKKIDNLYECFNLQELNLSYNYISKIENLDTLGKLKTLDISENSIKRLENLNSLESLEILNLAGNLIKEIPKPSISGLKSLCFFNISKNKISRISEFANLEVLPSLESLNSAGNLVKQADLKEFIPICLAHLKLLDGETVCHNPSQNASVWVIKENLKDLKQELIETSKEIKKIRKELGIVQEKILMIEKSAPDKKYMKELLDRADVLHNTSINLQKTMTDKRDQLEKSTQRLQNIKNEEKNSGNYIVEEIRLLDEIKLLKEQIEELESQYAVVLEELEKIAEEITNIDNVINNTPKFKNTELSSIETQRKDLIKLLENKQKNIESLKEKIDECNELLGTTVEDREFRKIMDFL